MTTIALLNHICIFASKEKEEEEREKEEEKTKNRRKKKKKTKMLFLHYEFVTDVALLHRNVVNSIIHSAKNVVFGPGQPSAPGQQAALLALLVVTTAQVAVRRGR